MLIVGIDPDTKKHGVAWLLDGRIIKLASLATDDLVADLLNAAKSVPILIKLEDVNAHKPVFQRKDQNHRQMMRIAQNVGAVKHAATQLLDKLNTTHLKVNLVYPLPKAISGKQFNRDSFNAFTGWQGSSNGDTRDAAMIAMFGYVVNQPMDPFTTAMRAKLLFSNPKKKAGR